MTALVDHILNSISDFSEQPPWCLLPKGSDDLSLLHSFEKEWFLGSSLSGNVNFSKDEECWKRKFLEHTPERLFALGSEDQWRLFWRRLQKLPTGQPLLDLCEEVLHWLQPLVTDELLESLVKEIPSDSSYQRHLLGILPYASGFLSAVLIYFPHGVMTRPHRHPEAFTEYILKGSFLELPLTPRDNASFSWEGHENHYPAGSVLSGYSRFGKPHIAMATSGPVFSVAVFAGKSPMKIIGPDSINNLSLLREKLQNLNPSNDHELIKFL